MTREEKEILKIIPHIIRSRQKKMWIDYDAGAAVAEGVIFKGNKIVEILPW